MLCAVVPVQNEEASLGRVLDHLLALPVDLVLPVLNGSRDNSRAVAESYPPERVRPIHFKDALGIDVPRAVGAFHARRLGADIVLFVDGDMKGEIRGLLGKLAAGVRAGVDLCLTDCYPSGSQTSSTPLVMQLLLMRRTLNRVLGLDHLGSASPSHGPHAVSRRFLHTVPLRELAVPPVALVLAARHGLRIGIAAALPHCELGSPDRGPEHARLIAETIIGDYLEAFYVYDHQKRSRSLVGKTFDGYDHTRRRDLLAQYLSA